MFKHEFLKPLDVKRIDTLEGRRYSTPTGNVYPSVTTVLSSLTSKELEEWKKRVGDREARRIANVAASRGTSLHHLVEKYILNKEVNLHSEMPTISMLFRTLKSALQNINTVYGLEYAVFSDTLKTAGTIDLIAKYSGLNSIIDFKTARKLKSKDHIYNYCIQTTAYAIMVEENTGLQIDQIVIIVVGEEHLIPQIFVYPKEQFLLETRKIFEEFACAFQSKEKIQN